jgi:hypothetical protein
MIVVDRRQEAVAGLMRWLVLVVVLSRPRTKSKERGIRERKQRVVLHT